MWNALLFALSSLTGVVMYAGEDTPETRETMVVYATKDETPVDKTHTQTRIVTAEEIESHQWTTVAEVLHRVPGLGLTRAGGDGGITTIFARGAKSENLLVLLNGARLNDPSGVGRGFDFGGLSTHDVARIEILLGPQTTLYGTDASAGVVNIITRTGGERLEGTVTAELSDEDVDRQGVAVSGSAGAWRYAVSGERRHAASISARGDEASGPLEEDAHDNLSLNARFGRTIGDRGETSISLSSSDGELDIDASDGDDPNYTGDYTQQLVAWTYTHRLSERWDLGLDTDYTDTERSSRDEFDAAHPNDRSEGIYDGTSLRGELRAGVDLSEGASLMLGLAHEREEADGYSFSESSFGPFTSTWTGETETTALFATTDYRSQRGFDARFGVRYNDHSRFGDETTYSAGLGYRVAAIGTRFRASFGTGFKAPSVYQLYSSFGNQALEPETSDALELGWVTGFGEGRGEFGVSWYAHDYEDLIELYTDPDTFQSYYFNVDLAESEGIEAYLSYAWTNASVRVEYEDLSAENTSDPAAAVPLIRRPEEKAGLYLRVDATDKLHIAGDVLYYGMSSDTDFSSFPYRVVALDAYTLVGLAAGYALVDSLDLKLRAENLFDEDYVQILGYNTPGRRLFLGAAWRF